MPVWCRCPCPRPCLRAADPRTNGTRAACGGAVVPVPSVPVIVVPSRRGRMVAGGIIAPEHVYCPIVFVHGGVQLQEERHDATAHCACKMIHHPGVGGDVIIVLNNGRRRQKQRGLLRVPFVVTWESTRVQQRRIVAAGTPPLEVTVDVVDCCGQQQVDGFSVFALSLLSVMVIVWGGELGVSVKGGNDDQA